MSSGRSRPPRAAATLAAAAVGAVFACARQGTPPGGTPDRLPPVVVATRPDTFARVEALDDPIRIRFNERISERPASGTMDEAVVVSPETGEVSVDHGRDALEVKLSGGIRSGLVYRVTVLPVIQDLFGNVMRGPFEFVFSTGGELYFNAMAGLVVDRVTGDLVEGARVEARLRGSDEDAPVYVSRTDTSGIYVFRYMPPGTYDVVAFVDRDRDRQLDPFELQGSRLAELRGADTVLAELQGADTLLADVVMLTPDTSAARLARAEMADSDAIRLVFDDYLDPLWDPGRAEVSLGVVEDTLPETPARPAVPAVARVFHLHGYEDWQDSLFVADSTARAVADSVARSVVDSAAAAGDTAAAADSLGAGAPAGPAGARPALSRPNRPGRDRGGLPEGMPLPSRELVLLLDSVLPPGVPYEIRIEGVPNLNELPGGGGVDTLRRQPPEPPPSADTAGAATDTAGGGGERQDTTTGAAGAAADTSGVARDTSGVARDTSAVARDTSGAAAARDTSDVVRRPPPEGAGGPGRAGVVRTPDPRASGPAPPLGRARPARIPGFPSRSWSSGQPGAWPP